ncbi:MAG: hypothetical protein ACK5PP_04740 [Acidimicrobiales bacterium]
MTAPPAHDWMVIGPWWSWPRRPAPVSSSPRPGARATAPVLQKYADARLAERFLADPQDALRFLDEEDRVRTDRILARPVPTVDARGRKRLRREASVVTPIRKLYRHTHQRFYLVVCSVHCDRPGLPRAARDDMVRAEFVVRRRHRSPIPDPEPSKRAQLAAALDAALTARTTQRELVTTMAGRLTGVADSDPIMPVLASVARAGDAVALAEAHLAATAASVTGPTVDQCWAPGADGEPPDWRPAGDASGPEVSYPMFPLVPPASGGDHDARHGTIYFGLVPTGSDETAPDGTPRFTPTDDYRIRCVVHRRNPACPDRADRAIPVWSEPTEVFRLAAHTDPLGVANRRVDLPGPDLAQLRAQLALVGPGRLASARMTQPAGSRFSFVGDGGAALPDGARQEDGDEVCFFAIPLITFVAMFLLQIFLPILLFLLGLWWMLQLKFCLPPSFGADIDLSSDLVVRPGGFELDAVVDFDVELDASERAAVDTVVQQQLTAVLGGASAGAMADELSLQERWKILRTIQLAQEAAAAGTQRTGGALLPAVRVAWEEVSLR